MARFYSASTGGLYLDSHHGDQMPDDVVKIEEDRYWELLDGDSKGFEIFAGADGHPDLRVRTPWVPQVVTMYQARAALLHAGRLDDVETALVALPEGIEKRQARLAWEYATTVERASTFVTMLAGALDLSSHEVDELFRAASLVQ